MTLDRDPGTLGTGGYVTAPEVVVAAPQVVQETQVIAPRDFVRWGPVLAGLVVGLERGDPLPGALGLALGAAAANAELPGAGALDAARARSLADRADIQQV